MHNSYRTMLTPILPIINPYKELEAESPIAPNKAASKNNYMNNLNNLPPGSSYFGRFLERTVGNFNALFVLF